MHYHAEVWIKDIKNVEKQIDDIMSQYSENNEDAENAFCDWWQIGGRWTGTHDGYNPVDDPQNWKACQVCAGTGFRNDDVGKQAREKDPSYTCNGCGMFDTASGQWKHGELGAGITLKWPTEFATHPRDIIAVPKMEDDLGCYTLIVDDLIISQVFHVEEWNGNDFVATDFDGRVKSKLNKLGITNGFLVTVDYHD